MAFCTGVLAIGRFGINLGTEALRTLAFVVLVFGSQAKLYAIRQRRHLWGSSPSLLLAVSSVADIVIASTLAVGGIAMTPLPASVGTVIANSPNPAGQSILASRFGEAGISPLYLFLGALVPTLSAGAAFMLLP